MSEMIVQHGDIEAIARMVASMYAELAALRARAEKAEAEGERLRAEVERLRNCCDELRAIGNIIHDPRVHNTITIAEWCDEAQAELRRLKSGHCKDCCCARSWEALEITGYTGKSIPEEIEALKAEVERLRADAEMRGIWEQTAANLLVRAEKAEAEVERLREALKSTAAFLHHCWCDVQMSEYSFQKLNEQMEIVHTAIDAARGES